MSGIKPKKGDLIQIHRGVFQHWAIYVGDGYVIHLTLPPEETGNGHSSPMSGSCNRAVVKKEKLSDVVEGSIYQVNNLLDEKYEPRDIEVIVEEAENLVGRSLFYSLIIKNCEHFVTGLRYGKPESRQVRGVVDLVKIAIPPLGELAEASIGPVRVLDLVSLGPQVGMIALAFGPAGLRAAASLISGVKKNKY